MTDNNLLGRCTVAYTEAVNALDYPQHTTCSRQTGVRAVIDHLAAELLVMHQRNESRLSAHDAAQMLREAVQ